MYAMISERMDVLKSRFLATEQLIDDHLVSSAVSESQLRRVSRLLVGLRAEVDGLSAVLAAIEDDNENELIARESHLKTIRRQLLATEEDKPQSDDHDVRHDSRPAMKSTLGSVGRKGGRKVSEIRFKCNYHLCGKAYKTSAGFVAHLKRFHSKPQMSANAVKKKRKCPKVLQCFVCRKTLKTKTGFERHLQREHSRRELSSRRAKMGSKGHKLKARKELNCAKCMKTYLSDYKLSKHLANVHKSKP